VRKANHADVIIVGGGAAGCVLAARLSEDAKRDVLLVEAGSDYPDLKALPDSLKLADGNWVSDSRFLWRYDGIVMTGQGVTPVLRGKVIGGSGAVNGCAFLRGVPEDYDSWGSPAWAWEAVLPYFCKLEKDLDFGGPEHGSSGPVPIRRYRRDEWLPFSDAFYRAVLAAGFDEHPDMNLSRGEGVGPIPRNNPYGVRMSTALTHLAPARERSNLTILGNVMTTRILVRRGQTYGIEGISGGAQLVLHAPVVVLSAGAIASPQLLMLSGLGPSEHLSTLGIRVIEDLPGVGGNLRDHPGVGLSLQPADNYQPPASSPQTQVGLMWTAPGSSTRRDMLINPHGFHPAAADPVTGLQPLRLSCSLELAHSIGRLTLTSERPDVSPCIEHHYMEDSRDRQRMRDALRLCALISKDSAFDDIVIRTLKPTEHELDDDSALDDWVADNVRSAYHTCGTCKMGSVADEEAVVDDQCRVRGVTGLRVADLSIAPNSVRANPYATAVMLAERAADLISGSL
jgi:choline dehydrogenase